MECLLRNLLPNIARHEGGAALRSLAEVIRTLAVGIPPVAIGILR